jgi:dTDP-4-dehydrorhamnose 3,5-epimerase
MNAIATSLKDVFILEPKVFGDDRGFFFESFNRRELAKVIGRDIDIVQDNHSRSAKNVLRGLHYQTQQTQAKLVRVIAGEIYDVVVDLRKSSPTFGKWVGTTLSAANKRMLWVPEGFAHGFVATVDGTEMMYRTSDYWAPEFERSILWNDPALAIDWPLDGDPILSAKDQKGLLFKDAPMFP